MKTFKKAKPPSTRETLLAEIEAFVERHRDAGMTATRFGVECLSNPRFVHNLRRGRDFQTKTLDKARHFMAAGWPQKKSGDGARESGIVFQLRV